MTATEARKITEANKVNENQKTQQFVKAILEKIKKNTLNAVTI